MKVCVSDIFFSTNKNLIISRDSYSWSESRSDCDLFLDINEKCSLYQFLDIFGIELKRIISPHYVKLIQSLNIEKPIWKFLLTSSDYRDFKRKLQDVTRDIQSLIGSNDYFSHYSSGNKILNQLCYPCVDSKLLNILINKEENPNIKSLLKSFTPNKEGFSDRVVYDRLKTITGRLVVKSGPQILLLPKDSRKVLISRYGDLGSIVSIDFVSLEPRFAKLAVSGVAPKDIYSEINSVNNFDFSRKQIKLAVLATLYGAGVNKVEEILGNSAFLVHKKICEYFGFNEIVSMAGDFPSGSIKNYFGRRIKLKKSVKNIAINNFIQSSCVDVALKGFSSLELPHKAIPIAVIHDAIVLDVLNSDLPALDDIVNKGIEIDGLGHFPLSMEKI